MLADFVRHTDLDIVMLADRYTLLEQGALDDLLPLCLERQVSVIAAGVFNSGLLASDRPIALRVGQETGRSMLPGDRDERSSTRWRRPYSSCGTSTTR